jgi:hypothetical protein
MLSALAAVLALGLFGLMPALSQGMGSGPEEKDPTDIPDAPSPQQKVLASLAGEFDVVTKMWMAPGQDPTVLKSTNTRSMILGGNYLREPYAVKEGQFQHEGELTWCYDPKTKKLQMTHLTSMEPILKVLETEWDGKAKVVEFKFSGSMVWEGKAMDYNSRYVLNWDSGDKQVLEVRSAYKGEDGKYGDEIKEVEVTYTRKAAKKEG